MSPKKIQTTSTLIEYEPGELDSDSWSLILAAKEIAEKAYAPYSGFLVGAAVLLENGKVFTANNQENVSFPVGVCAERLALGYAHGNFPESRPIKLAIVARRKATPKTYAAVTPCGLCRQSINEYEVKFGGEIEILILTPTGSVLKSKGIKNFLPFKLDDLNQ